MAPVYTLFIFDVIPLRAVAQWMMIPAVFIVILFICAWIQSKK